MNLLRFFVLIALSLLIGLQVCIGQDIIYKIDNDTINCIVKEIGDDEVKYIQPRVSETLVFGIDKNKIHKIILENGSVIDIENSLTGVGNYQDNKKNVLKICFLSPLFNSTNLTYERSIKPGRSFETTLGFIGVGNDVYDKNESGLFIKSGLKFIKSPDYYLKGQRYAHILKGSYVRPEIAFSYYTFERDENYFYYGNSNIEEYTNMMIAVMITVGKQWVIDNGLVFDWFFGFGYGFGEHNNYGSHKAFVGGVDDFPLALSLGVRVGWAF